MRQGDNTVLKECALPALVGVMEELLHGLAGHTALNDARQLHRAQCKCLCTTQGGAAKLAYVTQ